jgi:hypothetical protein
MSVNIFTVGKVKSLLSDVLLAFARCDILVALTVKIAVTVLWDTMSCSSVNGYKHLQELAASALMVQE